MRTPDESCSDLICPVRRLRTRRAFRPVPGGAPPLPRAAMGERAQVIVRARLGRMESWSATVVPRLPGAGQPLYLYDSARQDKHPSQPQGRGGLYVCGITPYDATHLGHAATMITFDLINRLWRDAGHEVVYVQNVTDIDDPLLERAARDHEDWI